MTLPPFVSHARNREDVVLHRALGHLPAGRYVEIGTPDPIGDSATRAFYQRGWSGVLVGPPATAVDDLRRTRPRDVVAATLGEVVDGAGTPDTDVALLLIGDQAVVPSVLAAADLRSWRPWVIVVGPPAPGRDAATDGWDQPILDADYRCCLFDGRSHFYVAAEHAAELGPRLSVPANVLDGYRAQAEIELEQRIEDAHTELAARIEALQAEHAAERAEWQRRDDDNLAAILQWRAAAVKALSRAPGATSRRDLDKLLHERHEMLERNHLQVKHIVMVDGELESVRRELAAAHEEIRRQQEIADHERTERAALQRTVSWRATVPLRLARRVGRRAPR